MNYNNLNITIVINNKLIIITITKKHNQKINKYIYYKKNKTIEIVTQQLSIPLNKIYNLINSIYKNAITSVSIILSTD